MQQDDTIFFKERGFGKLLGLGERCCIVVVDLIEGFTNPQMPMGYELGEQIGKVNELLREARKRDIPVVFTTIEYNESLLEGSNIWLTKMQGLKTLKAGTKAVAIDSRLDCQPDDDVMPKKYASAFFGTDLVTRLNTMHADTVIVTGCTTSGCVRATVVDALQYGYRPIVVEDAVGDRSADSHKQSLFDMRQKYADVMTTAELIEALSASEERLEA
ncbi:isochorismatase family protein [Paenibacillaceae bacterium WGS1546]|uniref:isochorismatase family protein n=1 Tax=Cohnella sp. WGS1546 TaxID=3366810 RepID=UPI00372D7D65